MNPKHEHQVHTKLLAHVRSADVIPRCASPVRLKPRSGSQAAICLGGTPGAGQPRTASVTGCAMPFGGCGKATVSALAKNRCIIESFGRPRRAGRPFCHAPSGTTSPGFRRDAQWGLSQYFAPIIGFRVLELPGVGAWIPLAVGIAVVAIDFCQSLKRGDCQ